LNGGEAEPLIKTDEFVPDDSNIKVNASLKRKASAESGLGLRTNSQKIIAIENESGKSGDN